MCKLILQNNTAEPNQNSKFVKYFRSKKYINKKHYNTNILIFHLEKE